MLLSDVGGHMILTGFIVGCILVLCLWFVIRRYDNNPSAINVWLITVVMMLCMAFVGQVLVSLYRYALSL